MNCTICGDEIERIETFFGKWEWAHLEQHPDHHATPKVTIRQLDDEVEITNNSNQSVIVTDEDIQ